MQGAPVLLADVGGTNTRLALYAQGALREDSIRRTPNASVASFEAGVDAYLKDITGPRPEHMCVAIAGPVAGKSGKLTNGAWCFDADALGVRFGFAGVKIINDLAALGYALPALPADAVTQIGPGEARGGQALVVGVATGFNVSLSTKERVFQAELGHASPPVRVMDVLQAALGNNARGFRTVEQCFSGPGLAKMHLHLNGTQADPADITRGTDAAALATRDLFAQALGVLCREMIYQYLPLGGLYFNGSLARAILSLDVARTVVREAGQDVAFAGRFGQVPLYLITDDAAALYGCARYMAD